MRGQPIISDKVRLFVVSLLVISLLTACAGEKKSSTKSETDPVNAALAASSRLSVDLPKSAKASNSSQAAKAAPLSNTEQAQPLPPEQVASPTPITVPTTAPLEPPPTESLAEETLAPEESVSPSPLLAQAQPQPNIDLSIPLGPKVGFRAPDFTLQTVDGQTIGLSNLLGRPLLINYWATWCVPCKAEMPILEKLSKEYGAKGVVFISINAIDQDSLDKVQALVGELGMTFPVLLDDGRQFAEGYQAIFFPTTFMVDANGVIREVSLGDNTEEELRSSLDRLLAGSF